MKKFTLFPLLCIFTLSLTSCASQKDKHVYHGFAELFEAAEKGDAVALDLACATFRDVPTLPEPMHSRAITWCAVSAMGGDIHAQRMMSKIYKNGLYGAEIDQKFSLYWEGLTYDDPTVLAAFQKRGEKEIGIDAMAEVMSAVRKGRVPLCTNPVFPASLRNAHCKQ